MALNAEVIINELAMKIAKLEVDLAVAHSQLLPPSDNTVDEATEDTSNYDGTFDGRTNEDGIVMDGPDEPGTHEQWECPISGCGLCVDARVILDEDEGIHNPS